ncbi:late secretory pathway protein avl9 [Modicella reniformis]|uniref:Late secretory pathway protein avl9 n=1 Tax=Modicella reniformis TaxID=1440133 RepID=A0A9P6MKZ7_9FUNG|nr:late secretory pathway protein avl9 [Modicella reniformis]
MHMVPSSRRNDASATLFGISCNRQIFTKDLIVKTSDVTRSSVQKAVVVLATQPIFGVLRQRLAVVTAAWFEQKDFTHTNILRVRDLASETLKESSHGLFSVWEFYDSLNATIPDNIPDSAFMMGTSLRELVKKFKYKVLVILKLLLLEKKVIFFGYPVETLCTYQYSLISLVPGLLKSLQDTGSPLLDSQELYMQSMSKTPAHSTDKQALYKYLGLPLHIFGEGSFFQPYLPLQQIEILQKPWTRSYVIGTTNAIFLHNRDIATDVIINTEPGTIEFLQDSLSSILSLTYADRRWMDEIIEAVNNSDLNGAQTEYAGSDDYLRAKFEEYLLTLLSSVKHSQFTPMDETIENIGSSSMDKTLTADYGMYFVKAWQQTPNFQLWNDYVDWELLNEIIAPGHPCQGNFSLAHVQRRLANQFKDMGIDKNLQPLKQSFSRAMTTSKERLSNVFDTVWQEFERLQPEEGGEAGPGDANAGSFDPSVYTLRSKAPAARNKGIRNSISINTVQRANSRILPDPELSPEDDLHDAIVPPPTNKAIQRRLSSGASISGGCGEGVSGDGSPRPSSIIGSPVSTLSSTLGPATAATAALGQKAAGMLSGVSSFFQAKKKEILDAQREAEEEYQQQRIHQHERKKRLMQERARATASTFAISPKQTLKLGGSSSVGASASCSPGPDSRASVRVSTSSLPSSSSTTPANDLYAYVAPKSPPVRSSLSPRQHSSPAAVTSTPTIAMVVAQIAPKEPTTTTTTTAGAGPIESVSRSGTDPAPLDIVSPIPTVPILLSPTLTRGSSSHGDDGSSSNGEGGGGQGMSGDTDLDQESQKEIEKELLEAIESSNEISKQDRLPESSSPGVATAVLPPSATIMKTMTPPPRQLTPGGETYSPFSEISAPSSPIKSDAEVKAEAEAQMAKATKDTSLSNPEPIKKRAEKEEEEEKEEKEEKEKEGQNEVEQNC